jgi:hypothetical protein
MTLRERMGREASPSVAVLDSQSVKSAERGQPDRAQATAVFYFADLHPGPQHRDLGRVVVDQLFRHADLAAAVLTDGLFHGSPPYFAPHSQPPVISIIDGSNPAADRATGPAALPRRSRSQPRSTLPQRLPSILDQRSEFGLALDHFSILKRGIYGVYHHVSQQHLKRYLAEFDFRYNERIALGIDDAERTTRALRGIVGKRLTYREGVRR